jgi:serine/threonine protein kinase
MDSNGHLKISDFGLSKILESSDDKAYTLCGTPQYLAPEILKNKGYDKSVDWWSLGCFLYEMLTGYLPFYIPKGNKINPKVFEEPLRFPPDVNQVAINLISQLLNVNPKKRLGSGEEDAQKIKSHPYFKGIDWEKYANKEIEAPFKPELDDEMDLRYFDKMFTDEPVDSNRPTVYSRPREHSVYKDFTYVTNSVQKDMMKTETLEEKEIDKATGQPDS